MKAPYFTENGDKVLCDLSDKKVGFDPSPRILLRGNDVEKEREMFPLAFQNFLLSLIPPIGIGSEVSQTSLCPLPTCSSHVASSVWEMLLARTFGAE